MSVAAAAGQIRLMLAASMPGQSLPSDWSLPIESDEAVLAVARLPADLPCAGIVGVVASRTGLAGVEPDDAMCEQIAGALADALLREFES